jgi:cytoskeletal protein CcmA (bactofilin family)
MFGLGKSSKCSRIDTVIGQQTRLEGDLHFSGGLHIDGVVKGNIIAEAGSDAVLTVSEEGRIEGDVRVPNLVLNGAVVGDVYVSGRVELASHAKVTGNVFYNLIEMAMGAEVNGSLVHREDAQRQMPKTAAEPASADSVEEPGMKLAK